MGPPTCFPSLTTPLEHLSLGRHKNLPRARNLMRIVRLPGIHHDANATLVMGNVGNLLIDVGTSWYQLLIHERLVGQIPEGGGLSAILLTCRRFNHAGGASFISSQFSNAPIHIEAGASAALAMGDFASTGAGRFDSDMPPTETEAVVDGQQWDLGDCIVEAISTPGHTGDGMTYWVPDKQVASTGPLVPHANHPSRWDMMGGCLPDLADSIDVLLDLELKMLIPAHGGTVSGTNEVETVLNKHLSFFEECIADDGSSPSNWPRPSQMSTFLSPRPSWNVHIKEEE